MEPSTTSEVSTGSGAAVGAAIGSVIPGIGTAIGAVVGTIAGFLGGIKGTTPHLSWNDAANLTIPLADKLNDAINASASASVLSELNSSFPALAANAVQTCNWWKVGNDQLGGRIPSDIRSDPTPVGTIWRVLMWAFMNAPSDNYRDAYQAITEIFNKSLYLILNKGNTNLSRVIDIALAGATGQPIPAVSTSSISTPGTAAGIITSVLDKVKSIFTGSSSSTGTGTDTVKAGLSPVVIILIAGAALFVIYNMIKKGKPL